MSEKIAVITGTSSGIGHAMTKSLLERGFVVYGGSRTETSIDHQNFIDLELDVKDESSVISFYKEIAKETEVIDVLINNAGVCEMASIQETHAKEFVDHFNTNTLGSFYLLKYFEPFILSGDSQVINIMSISAKHAFANTASYSMSEFAKRGLLSVIQKEFKKYQVRFNNFYVGAIDTPIWESYEEVETEKMLSIKDFCYVFESVLGAPKNIQFPDITFLHAEGYLD